MSFYQKHPYLFWQLIGWGVLLADFGFLVAAALLDFGEWCYPVMVFTFIAGLFTVAASPVVLRLKFKRLIPQNQNARDDRFFYSKISEVMAVRCGRTREAWAAVLVVVSLLGFMFASFPLVEYVHVVLGFVSMALAFVTPFLIILIHSSSISRRFFAVKNGEKLVDIVPPPDLRTLAGETPTLIIVGEPGAVLLNIFYNWLHPYLRGERLTLYRVTASELCRDYSPSGFLSYQDVLFLIPTEQLDFTKEKSQIILRECGVMGALPFMTLADKLINKEKYNESL